jgi:hypothetical protein
MKTPSIWVLAAIVVLAGFGAYRTTVDLRADSAPAGPTDEAANALMRWLNASPRQQAELHADDPNFAADLVRLRTELQTRRSELAVSLEDPAASDAQIRSRVEAVIAASAALERRVTDYLLLVRKHLTAEQQRRLFGLCAEGVRQGPGRRWRGGTEDDGAGRGRGPGGGRGLGRGGGGGPWWQQDQPATEPAAR